jgi:hypothetical protein
VIGSMPHLFLCAHHSSLFTPIISRPPPLDNNPNCMYAYLPSQAFQVGKQALISPPSTQRTPRKERNFSTLCAFGVLCG